MSGLIAGLVLFLGTHLARVMVPGFRQSVINHRGEGIWKSVYAIISFAGLVVLIWGYGMARASADNFIVYVPPEWMRHLVWLLMIPAMIFLIASQLPTGHIKARIKNPMLTGVKIWAGAHLLVNGDIASIILFVAFLAWAVIVVVDTKRRGLPVTQIESRSSDIIAILTGIGLWAVFMYALHEWLIGVAIIA